MVIRKFREEIKKNEIIKKNYNTYRTLHNSGEIAQKIMIVFFSFFGK